MLLSLVSPRAAILAAGVLFLYQPYGENPSSDRRGLDASTAPTHERNADPVLVGAGDIASCESSGDERTASLLDDIRGAIFTVGDNAYLSGRMRNPFPCYDASWGRHKSRTHPVPGNHEYQEGYLDAYFDYFGDAAGERGKGYYSYDVGTWHIIALNSNISTGSLSDQGKWLTRDLADHERLCTLAYFHHPRFSSGPHPTSRNAIRLWNAIAGKGVDVVVSGHDHIYERFAPMDELGDVDEKWGAREFVVGTGGASHYEIDNVAPNSEVRNADTYGVIKFTLHEDGYDWEFVPVRDRDFSDTGSAKCH